MKTPYITPDILEVSLQHHGIICTSDWDVIGPGQPNQPAGSRDWDEWEERSGNF